MAYFRDFRKLDNVPQESFFGHMKDELDFSDCNLYDEVKVMIDDWIDYYYIARYQWDLAKLSPNEFNNYIITSNYPLPKTKNRLSISVICGSLFTKS